MTTLETLKAARELSRRSIHTAYLWNDHNFPPAHTLAVETCKRVGISNIETAEEFLAAFDAAISKAEGNL